MSIRNLEFLFDPSSIAVIGASTRPGSIGSAVWRNLIAGNYRGTLYAVNPKYRTIGDHPVLAHARDLPSAPGLAIVCTPAPTLPSLIGTLARLGTRAAVVMTPDMTQVQKQGMLDAARGGLLRILGPDSMGLVAPHKALNASYFPTDALPGELAFVSQSNALATAMLDWSRGRGIGFSHFLSLGEHADVDFGDMLDYLASDPGTRAILMHTLAVEAAPKFMSAARAAARNKPVIVVKAGHVKTDMLPGGAVMIDPDRVFEAAVARAGMLQVDTLQELFLAAQTLARFRGNRSDSLTILGNGSGALTTAADAAARAAVPLSELSPALIQQLSRVLPANWSHGNPIDILGDAPVQRYQQTLSLLNGDAAAGALLVIHAPTVMVDSADMAQALLPLSIPAPGAPPRVMSCWLGDRLVAGARSVFQGGGIPDFDTPEQAVSAFSMLLRYRRNQAELSEAAPATLPDCHLDTGTLRTLVRAVLDSGRDVLSESETLKFLRACGIDMAAAQEVAVVRARRQHAHELRVGSRIDPVFGPVVFLGPGGACSGTAPDHAVALPPLNLPLARALVSRTGVASLLMDPGALHHVLLAVSQVLAEIAELCEIDINPLLVSVEGVVALGARIRLSAEAPAGADNFAIRPYPAALEEAVEWNGQTLLLRPIRPEDEALHIDFLQNLDPQDVRMRVFYSRRSIEHSELARLVQIDYAREMAFIALAPDAGGRQQTLGVVRAMADPDNIEAEFGVIVGSSLKGRGLGLLLMRKMISYLRGRGIQRLVATVLDHNDRMLRLARELGFAEEPAGNGLRKICLTLNERQ